MTIVYVVFCSFSWQSQLMPLSRLPHKLATQDDDIDENGADDDVGVGGDDEDGVWWS